jgi:hypothetical protein
VRLDVHLSSGESVFLYLVLDFLFGVCQEDSRGRIRGRHLLVVALQSWEELGVQSARLGELQSRSDVSGHSEVRILVDSARDKTKDVLGVLKHF